jgi:hypothetical protein
MANQLSSFFFFGVVLFSCINSALATTTVSDACWLRIDQTKGQRVTQDQDPYTFHLAGSILKRLTGTEPTTLSRQNRSSKNNLQELRGTREIVKEEIQALERSNDFEAPLWFDDWRVNSKTTVSNDGSEINFTINNLKADSYSRAYKMPISVDSVRDGNVHRITINYGDNFNPEVFEVPVAEFSGSWTPSELSNLVYRKLQVANAQYRAQRLRALNTLDRQLGVAETSLAIEESGYGGGSSSIDYSRAISAALEHWDIKIDD